MSFITTLTTVLTTLASPITEIIKGKQKIAKARSAAKLRSIYSDNEMDKNSRATAGWMDDVSFFVFLTPAVLAFYPPALVHVKAGFVALESMPQWYQAALGMMLVSVWGYRKLVSPIIQSVAEAYLGRRKL